jgi:preprotein translocase subunit YajC
MSPVGLILIVVAFLFVYLAFLRPQRQRLSGQRQMWQELEAGDEIVTAGGLYGHITGFADDDVLVEIAPGIEVKVARRAIAGVVDPTSAEPSELEPENGTRSPEGGRYSGDPP